MQQVFSSIFTSALAFISLTEYITIIIKSDGNEKIAEINFMIFAITFNLSSIRKKNRKKRFNPSFNSISLLVNVFEYLLSIIDLDIRKLEIEVGTDEPSKYAIRSGVYSSLLYYGLQRIAIATKNFNCDNIIISKSNHNKSNIHYNLKIGFFPIDLLRLPMKFLRDFLSETVNRGRSRRKYGGKQNE